MKRNPKSARVLQRILNARQFCLKLIANVTYGYTAAGFSGRMPMAELADSIVQVYFLRPDSNIHDMSSRAEAGQSATTSWAPGILPILQAVLHNAASPRLITRQTVTPVVTEAYRRGAQSARETLENAIRMVEQHPQWDAHVVYGDTDSLFVQLPGRCAR